MIRRMYSPDPLLCALILIVVEECENDVYTHRCGVGTLLIAYHPLSEEDVCQRRAAHLTPSFRVGGLWCCVGVQTIFFIILIAACGGFSFPKCK